MPKSQTSSREKSGYQASLGAAIRQHRAGLGITQEELAWRADMHRSYLADIERGGRNITMRSIVNLARALEVSMAKLFQSVEHAAGSAGPAISVPATPKQGEILLIEDNRADEDLALRALRRAKITNPVRVARDGAAALEILLGPGQRSRRHPVPLPQLVLLDLNLPKISGLEVLRRLKENQRTRSLPVVVLTVSAQDDNMRECSRLGAEHYIVKPLSFDGLIRVTPHLKLRWALLQPSGTGGRIVPY